MAVSTKLFADQMLNRFARINEQVELRQTKISTGQNITEASEKPIDAIKLSALEERVTQLQGFQRNVDTAQQRLSLGDTVLTSVDNILSQLRERAVAANTDTLGVDDLQAFRVEVAELRDALLSLANTRTTDGQALFGGYATDIVPFVQNAQGRVEYLGDGGEHTLAASESMRLPTSLNGGATFMQVQTENGRASIFDIVDSFEAALMTKPFVQSTLSASAADGLSLSFNGDRVPRDWSFTLQGPNGSATITVQDVVGGSNTNLTAAINASSDDTGVSAQNSPDGRLILSAGSAEGGVIQLSDLKIEGVTRAEREVRFSVTTNDTPPKTFVPAVQTINGQLSPIVAAGQDIALSRTTVGARLVRANDQEDALLTRSVALETQVNDLSAVDLERVITELQSLLITRDAARQAFVQISRSSLFDFLK
jgi:flagellar hook-associated protein 3 FlgL